MLAVMLFLMFFLLFLLGLFSLFIAAVVVFSRANRKRWQKVADQLGLQMLAPFLGSRSLQGQMGGFSVSVTAESRGKTSVLVAQVHGVHPGFSLGRDGSLQQLLSSDIEIGDVEFDRRIRVEGDPQLARALLGSKARRLATHVVGGPTGGGQLKKGDLKAPMREIKEAPAVLGQMVELAKLLKVPNPRDGIADLLAKRALEDPSRGVRLQALRQLSASARWRKMAHTTAEQCLRSPDPALCLEAARILLRSREARSMDRATDALLSLATQSHLELSTRATALKALTPQLAGEKAVTAMIRILDRRPQEPEPLRRAALDGLIAARSDRLMRLPVYSDSEHEALAAGLERLGQDAEERLVAMLRHPNDRVRLVAARSLKAVGTLEAVAPLRQVAGSERLFRSAAARTASEAIEAIKQRSGKSEQRGAISIAQVAPLVGAVSEADDAEAGGEVSLSS
ncbi:MAG: hypothetical protein AAF725_11920 [Acidobacteriota bacterium]